MSDCNAREWTRRPYFSHPNSGNLFTVIDGNGEPVAVLNEVESELIIGAHNATLRQTPQTPSADDLGGAVGDVMETEGHEAHELTPLPALSPDGTSTASALALEEIARKASKQIRVTGFVEDVLKHNKQLILAALQQVRDNKDQKMREALEQIVNDDVSAREWCREQHDAGRLDYHLSDWMVHVARAALSSSEASK